jgi:hypothetical protein
MIRHLACSIEMLPITIAPAWIEDSRLDHLPPFSSQAKVAVAASGKAREPTGFAGPIFAWM